MDSKITEIQIKQYFEFIKTAAQHVLEKSGIEKDGIQKLIVNNAKEFQERMSDIIYKLTRDNLFEKEEIKSDYKYPSVYKPENISNQIKTLREFFPNLGSANEKLAEEKLPPDAEGWFAIPRWEKIAPTYHEAAKKVIKAHCKSERTNREFFENTTLGLLKANIIFRHTERSIWAFQKLRDEQKAHDILIFPAQFGLRHKGRSSRRAREVMSFNEFGLGVFEVGIMLLSNPKRMRGNALEVACAATEYEFINNKSDDGGFYLKQEYYDNGDLDDFTHIFYYGSSGSVETMGKMIPHDFIGSASGFLSPHCLDQ